MKIKTALWRHQIQAQEAAIKSLDENGYFWLLAGCSTGKTLSGYSLIKELGVKKTIVFTTKAAITSAWVQNAERHVEDVNVVPLLNGTTATKVVQLLNAVKDVSKPTVVVVNYETAMRMHTVIRDAGFELALSDESHKIKSHNSTVSNNLAAACENVRYKLAMTGTGFHDRPTDVYGQVRYLKPMLGYRKKLWSSYILGSWDSFFDRYVNYRMHENIKIPLSYKNLDALTATLNPFTMMIDTEKVIDLPEQHHVEVYVDLDREQQRLYNDLRKDFIALVEEGEVRADNVLALGLRLHQVTGGYYQPTETDQPVAIKGVNPKLDAVLNILDELDRKPVVIFTRFTTDVHVLKNAIEKAGYKVKLLVGGCHQHVEFQNGDGDVLIANISAGAAGVDLTRARFAIFYSIGFSHTDYEQALWRVRRQGSDLRYPVTYFHIIARSTIDTVIRSSLSEKRDITEALLTGINKVW